MHEVTSMELDRLFYPRSIAVVGASPSLSSGGKFPYYQMIQWNGFKGRIYPVNPNYDEIDGARVYHSIDDLPEPIDLIIVSISAKNAVETMAAAARNKAKFIHFFTSGFSEVGNHGYEKAMVKIAKESGIRIIGPNCMGIHCSESGITCDIPQSTQRKIGVVAFLGQSGGMTNNFMRMAQSRYLDLNKVVSYGNQIDLGVEEYIEYLACDAGVKVIAAYIEDIKNSRAFMHALKKTTLIKPVIILKGGTTAEGARAAASHTGALAARHDIWTAMMRQCGCIEANNFENMMDLVMMGSAGHMPNGPRIGFLGAGGGTSVLFTDLATRQGLSLPQLNENTRGIIGGMIRDVNTSTVNPVDLGVFGFDFNIMAETMRAMDRDGGIDVIIPYFSLDFITSFQRDQIETGPHAIVKAAEKIDKPIIPILSKFTENSVEIEEVRIRITSMFRKAGLAVYSTPQDAIESLSGVLRWRMNQCRHGDSPVEREIKAL